MSQLDTLRGEVFIIAKRSSYTFVSPRQSSSTNDDAPSSVESPGWAHSLPGNKPAYISYTLADFLTPLPRHKEWMHTLLQTFSRHIHTYPLHKLRIPQATRPREKTSSTPRATTQTQTIVVIGQRESQKTYYGLQWVMEEMEVVVLVILE